MRARPLCACTLLRKAPCSDKAWIEGRCRLDQEHYTCRLSALRMQAHKPVPASCFFVS